MARRSRAREVALQLLFQRDQNATPMPRKAVAAFARERLTDAGLIEFCLALTDGVEAHREAIDKTVSATAENWRLSRMMPSDRNVLRMGTYELLHAASPEPVPVVIDEAVELARRFGTADSGGFVNGILDRIARSRKSEAGSRNSELGTGKSEVGTGEEDSSPSRRSDTEPPSVNQPAS